MVRQSIARQMALVRVMQVRVQNKNGVIFRGQRITSDGEILDTPHALIVRIQRHWIGVTVLPGQWWSVVGRIETRTFINSGGVEITEEQMEVEPGDAALCKPSAGHIVEYLARNPRFEGVGKMTAKRLWETFGDALFGDVGGDVVGNAHGLAQVGGGVGINPLLQRLLHALQVLRAPGTQVERRGGHGGCGGSHCKRGHQSCVQGCKTPSSSTLICSCTACKRVRQNANKAAPRW